MCVLVPFAVALVRAWRDGWLPSGDQANIATRALDVFSRHPPLTGLPSTSHQYGASIATKHPGPIEFYLLAIPVRVLGASAGSLLTAATINAGCALFALWAIFRRLGPNALLWAGVLMLALLRSGGTSVLTDTLSSNMTFYSLLGAAVLAWAVIDGDLRLLPVATLVASYAAQQHLAAGIIVAALGAVTVVAFGAQVAMRRRRGDPAIGTLDRRWMIAAAAVAAVGWLPVVYDEIKNRPGTLTQIARFARDDTRPTLGFHSGIDQAVHAIAPPTILGRHGATGSFFIQPLGLATALLGILVVVGLVAVVWATRSRSAALARLALVALVVTAAGVVNGSNIPDSGESLRVNLYRWTWAAAFTAWTALGLSLASVVGRAFAANPVIGRARRLAPPLLLAVTAAIATSTVFVARPSEDAWQRPAFALERRLDTAVLARIDRHHPLVVLFAGRASILSVGPHVIFRLVDAGLDVEVPDEWTPWYGDVGNHHLVGGKATPDDARDVDHSRAILG